MSQLPTRSLRLRSYATTDLDRLTGEKGEIFYDSQEQTLKIYNGAGIAPSTVNVGQPNRLTNGEYQLTLGSDGILTIQGEIQSTTSLGIAAIDVDPNAGPNGSSSGLYAEIFTMLYAYEDVILRANNNGVYKDWTFSTLGTFTAPGAVNAASILTTVIDSADSSAITVIPSTIFNSDVVVENELKISGSLTPSLDNTANLGSTNRRFANLYLGYDGLFLADQTTDANINITVDSGTLYVNGAQNLRLGELTIAGTTLTSANPELDISVGATNDTGFFYVKRKAHIDNTTFASTEAMLDVNASGGPEPTTIFPDTLIQTTSRPNKNSRVIQRSYGSIGTVGGDNSYAVWGSYAARGTVANPAPLKADDILARISANGYGATVWGSGGARVEFVALEDFTDSAKGTKINFWTVPQGQVASQTVAAIDSTGVVTAGVKFSGDDTLQTTAGIPLTQKGASSGVATLGVDGKLTAAQIPTSLTAAVVFKGTWNATTNTPALSNSLPVGLQNGWEYIVDVGGTRDIGDGSKTYVAGDFVIYNGTNWKQVPSGNLFTSLTGGGGITVSQSTGAMTLGSTATPLSNVSTIVSRDASGNFAANIITANLTGNVTGTVSGNAGTVTNGVYTNGSYANPSWITSLAASKVGLGSVENTALSTWAGSSNITTVGTLGSLTVTNLVTASNYAGRARDAGTLGGAGTLTIDFATDHNVLVTLTTTATIAFSNITAGKTVTVLIKNATGANRTINSGVVAGNTSGGDGTPNVNNGRTGVFVYRSFGTATTDVYCEVN